MTNWVLTVLGLKELVNQRPEEEKRATALCFSAAALVVILLI